MTREEAISWLEPFIWHEGEDVPIYGTDIEAIHMAIKALKQEPLLDKIRAEIEQNAYPIVHGVNNHELGMTLYGILQVIDKYKAESEGEDGEID